MTERTTRVAAELVLDGTDNGVDDVNRLAHDYIALLDECERLRGAVEYTQAWVFDNSASDTYYRNSSDLLRVVNAALEPEAES